ncbi:hypothetical protein J6590_063329 [Homalodisca vitripennis]|nr:hypothetical protein J6590_063329 [Homalodisca vitripennis]
MDGNNCYGQEDILNDLLNTSMISDLPTEGSGAENPVIEIVLDEDESFIINYDSADDTDMDPDWEPTDTEEPDNTTSLSRVRSNLIVGRDKKNIVIQRSSTYQQNTNSKYSDKTSRSLWTSLTKQTYDTTRHGAY